MTTRTFFSKTSPTGKRVPIIASLIALFVIGGGYVAYRYAHPYTPPLPAAPAPAPRAAAKEQPKPLLPDFAVAGAHKGEGPEKPLIRELIADPSLVDHTKNEYTGDHDDAKAVRQWAGHTAHVLALKAGLVGWKFGEEARVRVPDSVAFVIKRDDKSNVVIEQYAVAAFAATMAAKAKKPSPPSSKASAPAPSTASAPVNDVTQDGTPVTTVATLALAPTIEASNFLRHDGKTTLPPPYNQYLYMHIPGYTGAGDNGE